ncbi:hypothetical protein ACOSQ2_028511 [Xanthoceras sorbifolium]
MMEKPARELVRGEGELECRENRTILRKHVLWFESVVNPISRSSMHMKPLLASICQWPVREDVGLSSRRSSKEGNTGGELELKDSLEKWHFGMVARMDMWPVDLRSLTSSMVGHRLRSDSGFRSHNKVLTER